MGRSYNPTPRFWGWVRQALHRPLSKAYSCPHKPSFEEDKEMDINPRRGLKGLLAVRNKRALSGPQVPSSYQSPPSSSYPCNYSRTAPLSWLEEEEEKEERAKSGGRKGGSSEGGKTADSREDTVRAKVCRQQCTWAPQLKLDGADIP